MTDEIADPIDKPGIVLLFQMSWLILFEAVQSMPTLFASGCLAYGVVSFAIPAIGNPVPDILASDDVPLLLRQVASMIVSAIMGFPGALVLAGVAIPIHRLILLDESGDTGIALFSRRTFLFASWFVALNALFWITALPSSLLGFMDVNTLFVIGFAVLLALLFLYIRLSLVFPAIAVEGDAPLKVLIARGWRLSRGRSWQIVLTALLADLPLLGIVLVLMFVGLAAGGVGALFATVRVGADGSDATAALPLVARIAGVLLVVFGTALQAAVLSWIYRISSVESTRKVSEPA